MNFKEFFLENTGNIGSVSNARHHQVKTTTTIGDGGIHGDGKIGSLRMIAAYRTKKKDPNIANAKNGKVTRISEIQANDYAKRNHINLNELPKRLNSKNGIVLNKDEHGYFIVQPKNI
jgi:hypothetical protein